MGTIIQVNEVFNEVLARNAAIGAIRSLKTIGPYISLSDYYIIYITKI